jgi:glycogen debranching enzyme
LHQGYVLYDQLLYLQAQRALGRIHRAHHGSADHALEEKISRLTHLIEANYWFDDCDEIPQDAYHDVLYRKGCDSPKCRCSYWVSFFSPHGYGYRFDALANVLASLLGVAGEKRRQKVDEFIGQIVNDDLPLLPAFHPVIKPVDEDWTELQMSFSYTFKNQPYEYQNGGLWPMITGFYVADLAKRGRQDRASKFLDAIHRANALEMGGEPWCFPEYVHGKNLTPGGTSHQGWSAAAAVIGHAALAGALLFRG